MPYIIIIIGFVFLLYAISRLMKQSHSAKINKIFRYGFAVILGLLAYFFLIMAKNIPIGAILGILSFFSAQGGLWKILMNNSDGAGNNKKETSVNHKNAMTREEALEILGLSGHPSKSEIKEAHHKMMLKLHPDQGGSDYFASKLNQARDMLI
ncbi:MAG: hypothetical protein K9G26_07775 [Emcibacter sp.]|nr:hypothetical protein [Emcibacter sp.]